MNRNSESHFGTLASKSIRRSKFYMPFSHKFTAYAGKIVPMYAEEVLPGDTLKMRTSELIRMTTPIYPVMDNSWIDTYFFFVPRRLLWDHWEEFMGENKTDYWTQKTEYEIPQLEAPENGWDEKSIAHYLGARMNTSGISIDACYTRCYALIYNEWFRNQNLLEPAEISLGDAVTAGSNGDDYVVDLQKGGHMVSAGKFADYFTRALPAPQKSDDIYIPFGIQNAPVITTDEPQATGEHNKLLFTYADGTSMSGTVNKLAAFYGDQLGKAGDTSVTGPNPGVYPNNLMADLSEATGGATINQLRQAFAIQRLYEVDARGGTRYIEQIATHFGVQSPDARHQRPEYLGGKRVPVNISQVIQNSSTDATSPQGNTAAMSLTIDTHDCFTKSFTEHGIVMGLMVIRTEHTYQQGIPKKLSRKSRFDFYYPELANIGELPILNKEIYAQGTSEDDEVFGYQEAWAEYRYGINRISGELNSDYAQSLDSWHYADDYSQLPTLSGIWEQETDQNVARTLAIQDQAQYICDVYFDQTWTRPLPIYSIPSLSGWM